MRAPCRCHSLGASGLGLSPVASPYVDTLDDAVFVVDASVGGVAAFGCVALLLDADDRLLTVVECVACDTAARAVEFCTVLLAASTPAGTWRRLVVATGGRGRDVDPVETSLVDAWRALVAACERSPIQLVDWLVLDLPTGVVDSLRDSIDGRFPW